MEVYDFVHLVIHACDGRIRGRDGLQLVVYAVGTMTDLVPDLGYRPHYSGPRSSAVVAAIDDLVGLGFMHPDWDEYRLTPDGMRIAAEKVADHPREWDAIRGAVGKLGSLIRQSGP